MASRYPYTMEASDHSRPVILQPRQPSDEGIGDQEHCQVSLIHISVVFRESVRKNARDCFEKKGFAGNRHFQGTANFGYLESIKCHFEARNGKFGQILSRIQSFFLPIAFDCKRVLQEIATFMVQQI